jgi:hypothetical protein
MPKYSFLILRVAVGWSYVSPIEGNLSREKDRGPRTVLFNSLSLSLFLTQLLVGWGDEMG